MSRTLVFFRNDDVNRMEPGLAEITELFDRRGIPITHAVEPANLQPDTARWLRERAGRGVEIIQHGLAHTWHERGEFGGRRSAEAQERDLRLGMTLMKTAFGDDTFPAMSFPFGLYNEHTVPLLDRLGYRVVSCHWRHQLTRRLFAATGRMLGRGRWLGRHVPHHLRYYPGTAVREISVTVSPIIRYHADRGPTACDFLPVEELRRTFSACRRISPVVGVVLHHRFLGENVGLGRLDEFVTWLLDQEGIAFTDFAGVMRSLEASGR